MRRERGDDEEDDDGVRHADSVEMADFVDMKTISMTGGVEEEEVFVGDGVKDDDAGREEEAGEHAVVDLVVYKECAQ